jgi:predicted DNA-binding transcriptional regulator AlpA
MTHTDPQAKTFAAAPAGLDLLRVISPTEAAALLSLSPDTLARMSARGHGPPRLRISPRRAGYRIADIWAWLQQRDAI